MSGSPTPGPAPASAPTGRVSVESHGGQTQSTHRLCSPHPPRPLAGLPLRQGKSPVTGPGRLGPRGRGGTCTAPLPTYGCCRPRALLCQGGSEAGWGPWVGARRPEPFLPLAWPGCSLSDWKGPCPSWHASHSRELTPAAAPLGASREHPGASPSQGLRQMEDWIAPHTTPPHPTSPQGGR